MTKYVSDEEIHDWTCHHPPLTEVVVSAHVRVRQEFEELMVSMNGLLPEGPTKTTVLNKLRDAMMWANASVACAQAVYSEPDPAV